MKTLQRIVVPAVLAGTISAGVASEVMSASPAAAGAGSGESTAVAHAAKASSLTARAVKAARAFKASLTAGQREAVQYAFNSSAKETGWSNLPTSLVKRNGIDIADMTAAQQAKLKALLKLVLSGAGYKDEEATRWADQYLADNGGNSAGPGGGSTPSYGRGLYYVAFFGTPSTSKKWTIQFGGHHYQFHLTFSGDAVSNTPYFAGVEPRTAFTENGRTYTPMANESKALFGIVQSLNASQLAQAKLSQSFDDVLVGPQKDGRFPTKEGITVSSLSAAQRKLVTKAIEAYVGDFNSAFAKQRIALYESQYAKTKLAYSGTTSGTASGDYVRLQGPRLWLEIAVQNGIVFHNQTHFHSIERDIKSDYGAGT